ncbi:E7 [Morelia spilota papillomavirus 1]|uniref:Protein E7 n=1 Tax=Morelia spilota papillomavirus 1 TaxID=1081054 RepID=G3DRD1_9PAPI|nr:E7 [Morelia spilota papillomavirus 1]AEO16189.1 E7 [Morelia spilota papillomavirus 1]
MMIGPKLDVDLLCYEDLTSPNPDEAAIPAPPPSPSHPDLRAYTIDLGCGYCTKPLRFVTVATAECISLFNRLLLLDLYILCPECVDERDLDYYYGG